MLVSKWGNSLAVRIPHAVVNALSLHEGDNIEIVIEDNNRFKVGKKPLRTELLNRLKAYEQLIPADFKFNRDDANAR